MPKHLNIANMLGQRIRHGDYVLQEFPTDRDLAAEVGASKVTVRKAVQHLIDEGLLTRQANGRPIIQREAQPSRRRHLHIALLTVAYPSPVLEQWHQAIGRLAGKRGWRVRMVGYSHYGDPLVQQTLDSFDGIFFVPEPEDPPQFLIDKLRASANSVIVLNNDWTAYDLHCLWLASPVAVRTLLDHLSERGHSNVACLNTQPVSDVIRRRIEQWQLWSATRGQKADLIDDPVASYKSPSWKAYQVIKDKLSGASGAGAFGGAGVSSGAGVFSGAGVSPANNNTNGTTPNSLNATALFCTSAAAARGAMRGLKEHGIILGKDIAVCAADDDGGQAPLWTPSLTCIQEPDAAPYLDVCLDWMTQGGKNWLGPMLVEPAKVQIFEGETTAQDFAQNEFNELIFRQSGELIPV